MPYQDDPAVSQLLREINPSGDISRVLAGDAPVPTAPHSFPEECVFLYVPYVVHARIDRDGGKASLRQRPPDSDVARRIEIHSPTVDPDDRQRLRWRARGSKKDPAVDNIICGANIDQLLREFAWPLVLRMKVHPQPKKECWKSKEDRTKGTERELLFHRSKIRIVDGGSSAESKSGFRGWAKCARGVLELAITGSAWRRTILDMESGLELRSARGQVDMHGLSGSAKRDKSTPMPSILNVTLLNRDITH